MMLIGIAGTPNDFLLSPYVLKCYLCQSNDINKHIDIVVQQYGSIPPTRIEEEAETILRDIEEMQPDIVGFACYVWNMDAVRLISSKLKQRHENIIIVLGGPEIATEDIVSGVFDKYAVDYFISGEGELPLLALLNSQIRIRSEDEIKNIKGLAYKKGGKVLCNVEAEVLEDIDQLPSPYLEGYVSDEVLSMQDIRANIETQRGCNFKCAYCFYHKNFPKIRYRDADVVVKELEYVYKKGIKQGRIVDANFLSDKMYAKTILKGLIELEIRMDLLFEILPQFVDEEVAHLFGQYIRLSKENRVMVGMGIQTINQEALAVIKRKIPVRFFDKAFRLLQEEGVIIKSDIILGLPRETKESYFKTLEYITEKMRYGTNLLSLALLRMLPGTDLIKICESEDLINDNRDNSHFVYATPTLPRKDMLECLRLNVIAYRLLTSTGMMGIRDMYFDAKDTLNVMNIELLQYFESEVFCFLKEKDADYVKPDFPNAETYLGARIFSEISDVWLLEKFRIIKEHGILGSIQSVR